MSVVFAPKFEEGSHEETLIQERCARQAAWDLAKKITSSRIQTKLCFHVPGEVKAKQAPTSKRPEEREFVVDSGASMHMMSKKELSFEEMGTVKRSRNPIVVLTANGEVQTHEEAQVFVHDLNQFVTVQLLEETPAVLSQGKLCENHGYSYERSAVKSHDWPKMGRVLVARQTISYLMSFQGYAPMLKAFRPLYRYHRNRWEKKQTKPLETELVRAHLQVQYLSEMTNKPPGIPENPKPKKKRDDKKNADDPSADLPHW